MDSKASGKTPQNSWTLPIFPKDLPGSKRQNKIVFNRIEGRGIGIDFSRLVICLLFAYLSIFTVGLSQEINYIQSVKDSLSTLERAEALAKLEEMSRTYTWLTVLNIAVLVATILSFVFKYFIDKDY